VTARRGAFIALLVLAGGSVGWLLFAGLPRWYGAPARTAVVAPPAAVTPEDVRKIKARLFYVSDDGGRLTSVERDVPFADQTAAQARRIIDAQLAPPEAPLVSAIPPGTTLRAVFVTDEGAAFVDLSREVASAHPGGSLNELLTIYTVVQALTTNLPAITSVQLLVDGKEVDTLAGHVDIRRPLPRADEWVADNIAVAAQTTGSTSR
jgi:spore germination protein GerM